MSKEIYGLAVYKPEDVIALHWKNHTPACTGAVTPFFESIDAAKHALKTVYAPWSPENPMGFGKCCKTHLEIPAVATIHTLEVEDDVLNHMHQHSQMAIPGFLCTMPCPVEYITNPQIILQEDILHDEYMNANLSAGVSQLQQRMQHMEGLNHVFRNTPDATLETLVKNEKTSTMLRFLYGRAGILVAPGKHIPQIANLAQQMYGPCGIQYVDSLMLASDIFQKTEQKELDSGTPTRKASLLAMRAALEVVAAAAEMSGDFKLRGTIFSFQNATNKELRTLEAGS